jgi:WD40 repeat protein
VVVGTATPADALVLHSVAYLSWQLVAAVGAGGVVHLWDTRQLERKVAALETPTSARAPLLAVAGRPARPAWFVTGSGAGTVALWDVRTLSTVACAEARVHDGAVHALAYHPTAPSLVFSGSADGSVGTTTFDDDAVRPPAAHDRWRQMLASQLAVNAVAVAPGPEVLLAGTEDGAVLLKHVPQRL